MSSYHEPTVEEIQNILLSITRGHDDPNELFSALIKDELFAAMDLDHNGYVSIIELCDAIGRNNFSKDYIAALFSRLDKSNDGRIDKTEFLSLFDSEVDFELTRTALEKMFNAIDADKNEYVSIIELCDFLGRRKFTKDQITSLFSRLDVSNDGRVDKNEFLNVFNLPRLSKVERDRLFNEIDVDRNGYISIIELCDTLGKKNFSKDYIAALFTRLDKSNDGRIDRAEFNQLFNLRQVYKLDDVERLFNKIDVDRDRHISIIELCDALGRKNFNKDYIASIFSRLDRNNDGRVDFLEFASIFKI